MPEFHHGTILFTVEDLRPLVRYDCIVDATKGGLILGNSHSLSGVKMLRETNDNKYEIIAEVEGWEYIINPYATAKFMERLKEINDELPKLEGSFKRYKIPEGIDILDVKPIIKGLSITGKFLIISEYSQFVINKFSTKKYLRELDEINKTLPSIV